jgi:Tol biopolymer transport system component
MPGTAGMMPHRHRLRPPSALAALLTMLAPVTGLAQPPSAPWMTLDTPSFRVHYPEPYDAWAQRLAERLESIRREVAREVGYLPAIRTDVVVMDPRSTAGGAAVPFLRSPRMVLWTTAPPPESTIGHFDDWGTLVAIHEDVHVVQLVRPSRNPLVRVIARLLVPFGPIAVRAPRWVTEGYATMLEGRLTGRGRPYSDLRAAILRRWAQQGRLPSYERLSADREGWMGMSMAYLAGSAYLEWLQARAGPNSLRALWARMTARSDRSFVDAFQGVFGDTPSALYGRFSAELARDAMVLEEVIEPLRQDGELWQRFEWSTGRPAVSPDGTHFAIVLHGRDRPGQLAVFTMGPDAEAERERRNRMERLLANDPDDVPPVQVAPPPRQPIHVLPAINGAAPGSPRWIPDGESLLFVRFESDRDGILHPDLFRWHLRTGRVNRLTWLANLDRPDPSPDGTWAAAVRHRHGVSQIVRVSLASGDEEAITSPSVDVAYDSPRVSPDGRLLVFLRNAGQGWRAVVKRLDDGTEEVLPTPPHGTVADPAWSADGRDVYLSVGESGFIDIHAYPLDSAAPTRQMTRTHGAAFAAAPTPDGKGLFFLSLESHGLDVRLLDAEADAGPRPVLASPLLAVVPEAPPPGREWQDEPVGTRRPYGIGRQEFQPLVGGAYASATRALELGVRGGDLLGRLTYVAVGSLAAEDRGPAGALAGVAWRGWPVVLSGRLFHVAETPSLQPHPLEGVGRALDVTRRGGEVDVTWERFGRPYQGRAIGGMFVGQVRPSDGQWAGQQLVFAQGGYEARQSRDRVFVRHAVSVRGDVARTDGEPWQRLTLSLGGGAGHESFALGASLEQRSVHGRPAPFDRVSVGGMPSSVLPPAVVAGRRLAPPVPVGALIGDVHRAWRVELQSGAAPVLFYERHRVKDHGGPWGDPLSWIGMEIDVEGGPLPLLRLPSVQATLGLARVLDRPAGSRYRWWAGVRWTP